MAVLLDEAELHRFVEWLPDIGPGESYVLMLVARKKYAKQLGLNIRDTVLEFRQVAGGEGWRRRLVLRAKRLALLQQHADSLYEDREGRPIPPETVGIYIQVNPARWTRAAVKTAEAIHRALYDAAVGGKPLHETMPRPDRLFHREATAHFMKRFHSIDVDDCSLLDAVLSLLENLLGHTPATIRTPRCVHILVNVEAMSAEQRRRYFDPRGGVLAHINGLGGRSRDPATGAPLVEVHRQALEPLPGSRLAGHLVTFQPER